MLQVKNLTKIYRPKKGAEVRALDGVTLSFPDKGMVFLLGKSGSGKSTLLNVCGGLDSPTDGEIIVKGRSSKDFSQSDFDSYRNTYIGFIFQEYNILNEFTVEDNIALALELQGKSKDRAAINALLQQVELTDFAKRKPNTLSGGQKQRIAIARALIKNPEIIMADEPTGALDSNTGKQVLGILKNLSRDKLVVVVSHDRDFAEEYGDRIIELKDGKVISDISKTQKQQKALGGNMSYVDGVLTIKDGAALTEQDFDAIKQFLKKGGRESVIACNSRDIKNFKKASRINDSGDKEVFEDTAEPAIKEYSEDESRFISSKLPMRHAIKMGLSGLKNKPFRLMLTVLLCTVAFTMFGLLTTLNFYDSETTFRDTLAVTDKELIKLDKEYFATVQTFMNGAEDYAFETRMQGGFGEAELSHYQTSLSSDAFGAIYSSYNFGLRSVSSQYWKSGISNFAYLPEGNSLRETMVGSYPVSNDEIAITSYAADMLYACGTYDSKGVNIDLPDPLGIIGKKIGIAGSEFTVTGIIDSGAIDPRFESLLTGQNDEMLLREYDEYLSDTMHLTAFVSHERLQRLEAMNRTSYGDISGYTTAEAAGKEDGEYKFSGYINAAYCKISELDPEYAYFPLADATDSDVHDAVVDFNVLYNILMYQMNPLYEAASYDQSKWEALDRFQMDMSGAISGVIWEYPEDGGDPKEIRLGEDEMLQCAEDAVEFILANDFDLTFAMKLGNPTDGTSFGDAEEFTAVGIVYSPIPLGMSPVYIDDSKVDEFWEKQKPVVEHYEELYTDYVPAEDELYTSIFVPYSYSEALVDNLWNIFVDSELKEGEISSVGFGGSFIAKLASIDTTVKELSKVFLIIGLIMAVFAVLLFSNFISASISQKTRDIGILRAVGARGTDVFKIFFSESFVIALICAVLSIVSSTVVCGIINTQLNAGLGATLLSFGPLSVVVLLVSAFITAVASTFLPVNNAARKKPVDSIRSL